MQMATGCCGGRNTTKSQRSKSIRTRNIMSLPARVLAIFCFLALLTDTLSFSLNLHPSKHFGLSTRHEIACNNQRKSSHIAAFKMIQHNEDVGLLSSRRHALEHLLGGILVLSAIEPGKGAVYAAGEPAVTDKIYLDFKFTGRTKALENPKWEKIIARDKRAGASGSDTEGRIVIGLYGKEAPATVATFLQLVKGELLAPCIDEDEAFDENQFGVSDRDKLTKKQIYRQCKAREDTPLSYQYSQAWRIVKDQRIDLGRLNKLYIAAPKNEEANTLIHRPGSVSIKKGGGQFEFSIAPAASPQLDEENIVFGQVLEGMDVVNLLNEAPVSQGQFLEGAFKFSAKAIGDVRAKTTTVQKPLQKITITQCGTL